MKIKDLNMYKVYSTSTKHPKKCPKTSIQVRQWHGQKMYESLEGTRQVSSKCDDLILANLWSESEVVGATIFFFFF